MVCGFRGGTSWNVALFRPVAAELASTLQAMSLACELLFTTPPPKVAVLPTKTHAVTTGILAT